MGASIHAGKTDNQAPNKKAPDCLGHIEQFGESERIASTKAVERCAQQGESRMWWKATIHGSGRRIPPVPTNAIPWRFDFTVRSTRSSSD